MTRLALAYVLGTAEGGTGRHVVMLARGCARAGADVQVFGPAPIQSLLRANGGAGADVGAEVGFATVTIADRPRLARDLATVGRLRRLLCAMGPDIVHAHGVRAGAVAALALRPLPGLPWPDGGAPPLVVTMHNAPPAAAGTAAVYAVLERLVARRADVVLCVSGDLFARMRRLRAREVGRAVVPAPGGAGPDGAGPDGAGPDGAGPETAGVGGAGAVAAEFASGGRSVVLAVGRLAPQKGFDTLIAAAARWRDRRPEPLVVIAGTGPLAGELAAQARGADVDARFLGSRDDIGALLAVADVFVLPSRWEGQPLVLQEALRAGRPVVATDVGGVRELTGDDAALLVPAGDPASLAAAVLRVLDDSELAGTLGKAAAARAASFPTEPDAISAALALYDRLAPPAARRAGRPR